MSRDWLDAHRSCGLATACRLVFVLLPLVGAVACDRGIHVHGRVVSTKGPVRPAEIRVECPRLCAFGAVHDDNGNYSGFKLGGCPVSCRLRVRSAGYRDFESPLAKFCVKESAGTCWEVAADVTLQPASP
jgi:hypothetical protein